MISNLIKKLSDQKLSIKFLGAICIILIVLTVLDINYNAQKEREINERVLEEWTGLFAENVRVSLNTLMREGKMDVRFAMIENMANELKGIKDVRIIRADKTNIIFKEVNEKEVIPNLEKGIQNSLSEIKELESELKKSVDDAEREDIQGDINFLEEGLVVLREKIKLASKAIVTDPREQPGDDLDREVLEKGLPIYRYDGDNARVLIPYTAKKKGCSEASGCHTYAREGDVLGAINVEFSMGEINRKIEKNNLIMVGFWVLRFLIFLAVIGFLLRVIIIRRINVIVDAFGAISKGELSVRIPGNGQDEVGKMAEGFNLMAASIDETKKELDKRLLEVFALYNIGKVMNTSFETEQMMLELVKDMSKSEKIDRLMIMLFDEKKGYYYAASHTGFDGTSMDMLSRKPGEGFYGTVASSGQGRLVTDVEEEGLPSEDIIDADINSIIAVPFFSGENTVGLICAYKNRPEFFEQSDLDLFTGMSDHLSKALENSRFVEETKLKAITDGLTGLYNKSFFLDTLESELDKASRYERELSVFMLDIDNFKHYNDTNGHPEGDELLKELSALLKNALRSIDIPCRYGGEEFVVILPETSKKGAAVIAERLLATIRKHYFPYEESQPMGFVSVSIGLASFPSDADETAPLIKKMDEALYRAKHEGKNRLVAA